MGDIVNLNSFRKRKQKARAERLAAEHRIKFGRSSGEKSLLRREAERDKKELEAKRLDDNGNKP